MYSFHERTADTPPVPSLFYDPCFPPSLLPSSSLLFLSPSLSSLRSSSLLFPPLFFPSSPPPLPSPLPRLFLARLSASEDEHTMTAALHSMLAFVETHPIKNELKPALLQKIYVKSGGINGRLPRDVRLILFNK